MKIAVCLLISFGVVFGMNVPETTTLPKQPREESTFLPKDPRDDEDNEASWKTPWINVEDIVDPEWSKDPSEMEIDDQLQRMTRPIGCGQTVDLETEDKALLQSHKGFGTWYAPRYPPGQNCTWILEAPAGSTVKLFFYRMFDLPYGDWFIVREKDYYYGTSWQSFTVPFKIGPNENSINFRFSSNDDWKRGRGFRFVVVQTAFHL